MEGLVDGALSVFAVRQEVSGSGAGRLSISVVEWDTCFGTSQTVRGVLSADGSFSVRLRRGLLVRVIPERRGLSRVWPKWRDGQRSRPVRHAVPEGERADRRDGLPAREVRPRPRRALEALQRVLGALRG